MVWCGWTERETLDTTISSIIIAYEGVIEMHKLLNGVTEEKPQPQTGAIKNTKANVGHMKAALMAMATKQSAS